MTHRTPFALLLASGFMLAVASLASACDTETSTSSVIDNAYPASDGGAGAGAGNVVVYRAWWLTTYYADPVGPGGTSAVRRSVPGADTAYAVLAPGWDARSGAPPRVLVPIRSKAPIAADRGENLHIRVSDQTFAGNCASGQALSQDDADFITERIFPAEFAGMVYDARTCTLAAGASDAGAASPPDASRD